ncbi:hypothetical protein [uncultured Kordia sp.]|uniref:hypothetical protein n=1 Tax=uncultured Kordia sp. TaxID=507699 RepID=UPI002633E6DF|nr:hypothetical protein [uncultured Kordia sp.]
MKKKEIKNLKLNKKSISHLSSNSIQGGTIPTLGVICTITIPVSIAACTQWDGCDLPTIGHDDGSICLSKEADWCNGR